MAHASGKRGNSVQSGETSACRDALRSTWQVQGLRELTIRNRIAYFERAGGAEATRETVMAHLATLPCMSTRRTRLSDLRVSFKLLLGLGLLEKDPTVGIPRIKVPRWMPRPLGDDEIRTLLARTDGVLHEWIILALYAGLRAAEIAELRAEQLEHGPYGWTLHVQGKGDVEASIPAHPRVVQLLQGRRGRLWPDATPNSVTHKARYMFQKLGIEGGIHRCRHTFATRALAASGNDLLAVRDLLRHASVMTTQVYTQLPTGRLFDVMQKIA